jgi:hypothetical protein
MSNAPAALASSSALSSASRALSFFIFFSSCAALRIGTMKAHPAIATDLLQSLGDEARSLILKLAGKFCLLLGKLLFAGHVLLRLHKAALLVLADVLQAQ